MTDAVPSPQSKAYFTRSPSGSDDLVEKLYGIPEEPVDGPEGVSGVVGGLFPPETTGPVMETLSGFDQPESIPRLSVAFTRRLKTFIAPDGTVHLWETLTAISGLTKLVVEAVPSPQSKVYFT